MSPRNERWLSGFGEGLNPLSRQWRENKELGKQEESQHEPGGGGREGRGGGGKEGTGDKEGLK